MPHGTVDAFFREVIYGELNATDESQARMPLTTRSRLHTVASLS